MSHFFARFASQKTYGHARIARDSRMAEGFFDSRNVQKRATKVDTSGHCLVTALAYSD